VAVGSTYVPAVKLAFRPLYGAVTLKGLTLELTGTTSAAGVTLCVARDTNGDGQVTPAQDWVLMPAVAATDLPAKRWTYTFGYAPPINGLFELLVAIGVPSSAPLDQIIGVRAAVAAMAGWTMTIPSLTLGTATLFLVCDLPTTVPLDATIGFVIAEAAWVSVTSPGEVDASGFPLATTLATVTLPPVYTRLTGESLLPAQVAGGTAGPALKLTGTAVGGPTSLAQLQVQVEGTVEASAVTVALYRATGATGLFEDGVELLGEGIPHATTRCATITLANSLSLMPEVETVLFVRLTLAASATPETTVGVRVVGGVGSVIDPTGLPFATDLAILAP
jgi:hypothetical protein